MMMELIGLAVAGSIVLHAANWANETFLEPRRQRRRAQLLHRYLKAPLTADEPEPPSRPVPVRREPPMAPRTTRKDGALPEIKRGKLVVLRTGLRHPVWLRYTSYDKHTSERTVTVLQVLAPAPDAPISHIRGVCHTFGDSRTFLARSVQLAADGETGELIEDLNAFLLAKGHPPAPPGAGPRKLGDRPRKTKAEAPAANEPKRRGRPKKMPPEPGPRIEQGTDAVASDPGPVYRGGMTIVPPDGSKLPGEPEPSPRIDRSGHAAFPGAGAS